MSDLRCRLAIFANVRKFRRMNDKRLIEAISMESVGHANGFILSRAFQSIAGVRRLLATSSSAALIVGAALSLVACDSGRTPNSPTAPTPSPSPVNQAPVFSSGLSTTVAENTPTSTTVYQAAASDPEGAAVSYAITGGVDQARFTISSAGALKFVASPDYDLPADSDQDNVYEVEIAASDGSRDIRQTVRVNVTNDREGLALQEFCQGRGCGGVPKTVATFNLPMGPDGLYGVVAAGKDGEIEVIFPVNDQVPARLLPDISTDGDRGIIHMVSAPDFDASGIFYVMFTDSAGDIVIQRFPRGYLNNSAPAGPVILRIPHRQYNNNLGGWMGFAPDGSLYVATGDGGGSSDPLNTAQDLSSRLGKLLRLSPDFTTVTTVATGFRNPNGGSFYNGNIIIADRGETSREELDIIPLDGTVRNYGWPFKEGTMTLRTGGPNGMVDPLAECPHGPGGRGCYRLTGGTVYAGSAAALQGQYVFADRNYVYPDGSNRGGLFFTLPVSALVFGQATIQPNAFSARTADLFSGWAYLVDPTSFYQHGGVAYMTLDAGSVVKF